MNDNEKHINGQIEGRVESLENTFHEFIASDRDWQAEFAEGDRQFKSEVRQALQTINEKASNAGKTDFATLAIWAGLIVGIICSIVGGAEYLKNQKDEQNQQWILRDLNRIDSFQDGQTQRDLQELSERRRGDPSPAKISNKLPRRKMTAQQYLDQK